jgi:hypothetical protein
MKKLTQYFKELNLDALPKKVANYISGEVITDADIDLLDENNEDFVSVKNLISEKYPSAVVQSKVVVPKKAEGKEKITPISAEAKVFIPSGQYGIIKTNEEFEDARIRINEQVATCPKTYETEDIKTRDKIAQLHYFRGESDWYIIEKDSEIDQLQAFGYVILNGDDQNAEFGYINIEDVKRYAELDLYWTPVKMGTLMADDEGLEDEKHPIEEMEAANQNVSAEKQEALKVLEEIDFLISMSDGDDLSTLQKEKKDLEDIMDLL